MGVFFILEGIFCQVLAQQKQTGQLHNYYLSLADEN